MPYLFVVDNPLIEDSCSKRRFTILEIGKVAMFSTIVKIQQLRKSDRRTIKSTVSLQTVADLHALRRTFEVKFSVFISIFDRLQEKNCGA